MSAAERIHARRQARRSLGEGGQYGATKPGTSKAEALAVKHGYTPRDRGGPIGQTRNPSAHHMQLWVSVGIQGRADKQLQQLRRLQFRKSVLMERLRRIRQQRRDRKAKLKGGAGDTRAVAFLRQLNEREGDAKAALYAVRQLIKDAIERIQGTLEQLEEHKHFNVIALKAYNYGNSPNAERDPEQTGRHSGGMVAPSILNWR